MHKFYLYTPQDGTVRTYFAFRHWLLSLPQGTAGLTYISFRPRQNLGVIYLTGLHWQLSVEAGHRLLSPRSLCRPLSLHGISAGAGQACRGLLHPHNTPCMGTKSCCSSRKVMGYRNECTWSIYEIQSSQLRDREPARHIVPCFLIPDL